MSTSTTSADISTTGAAHPPRGRWTIDPGHAEVGFVGRHFGLTKIRGRFSGVSGDIVVAEDLERSTVEVRIDMATVTSGDPARDEHLRSSELFDIATHPVATFRSTAVHGQGSGGTVTGDLTIKGTTRAVTLDVEFLGALEDPWGGERAVFRAATTIDRYDFGVAWNMPLDTGGLLVSKDIRIEIEVELVRTED